MSGFNQLMMRAKGKQPVPANIIFTNVDSSEYITYKSRDGQTYWRKRYAGLCYGGFCVFQDGGSTWIIAFTVSEVQNNCIMYRNGDSRVLEISSSTLNYKGKDWYYSLNGNASNYNSATSTMINFNKNNGRYWIGGANKIYTGSNNNEKFIQVAKDFLDYIYTFDVEALTEGYTQLNYVQTSGSQYIKTGITPTSNTRVVTKIGVITSTQNIPVFGCNSSNAGDYYHLTPFNYKWYYGKNGGEGNAGSYSTSTGTTYEIDFNNNGSIIINGTTIATNIGTTGNAELMIAKRASSGDVRYGYWNYYKFQIYEGATLVRDYVPVIRNSDGKVGMLEQVNNIFCPSDGSGDFIGGQ